jgi:hypothetical protein
VVVVVVAVVAAVVAGDDDTTKTTAVAAPTRTRPGLDAARGKSELVRLLCRGTPRVAGVSPV